MFGHIVSMEHSSQVPSEKVKFICIALTEKFSKSSQIF